MSQKMKISRACLFAAALSFSAGIAGKAMASDPLPGDSIAPPVNVNIGLLYNQFNDAGALGALRGSNYTHDTHISDDITVLRYIRTGEIDGIEGGVQVYEPYVGFLGQQKVGLASTAPYPFGAGTANLSHTSGFAQPNFSFFFWPINDPKTNTYLVVSPWISPPISGFNKSSDLNPGQNSWVYELEIGLRTTLIGTPSTQNLQIEAWGEVYAFGNNSHSAYDIPSISANNIPFPANFVYHNPLPGTGTSTAATYREQPSETAYVYLPYEFAPALDAFIAPGFFQSFGGKQTYKIHGGPIVDSGNRTDESQLRLVLATFVAPTTQVMLAGAYDVAAHGEPLNRFIEFRLAHFF